MYGRGQGEEEMGSLWLEVCLSLHLFPLNHTSRLTGLVILGDLIAHLHNLQKKYLKERGVKLCYMEPACHTKNVYG